MDSAEGGCKKAKRGKPVPVLRVHKQGGVSSRNNRLKKQNKNVKFSILGTNSAGLKAKTDSLLHNIKLFNIQVASQSRKQNLEPLVQLN